ncbi:toll/interleukin-1 receptor domain-containing protein [Aggregatilinea lenta]|uniref:toll/interleukin-1 receptor domain-containing protein n=1 Tax=Aggregatilinea lenta TaxID=913108 RepID=UPI000E5AEF2E|nr:toll/interleukin-1 receptor domain-containing protein [Aggregatilinea lenta]
MSWVFLSYSRRDLDFVADFAARLRRRNVRVWMDKSDIKAGSNWQEAIRASVRASAVVIVVLSPDAAGSEWVGIELDEALDQGITVIPYVYQETELPLRLKRTQAIFHRDSEAFEQVTTALPATVRIHDSVVVERGLIGRPDLTLAQAAEGVHGALDGLYVMVAGQRIDLVGLPLRPTRYCSTYLVGRAADTLEWHSPVQLGLQFAQSYPGDHFASGIAAHCLVPESPDFKLRMLLIRGPLQIGYAPDRGYQAAYGLDPDAPDEWEDAVAAAHMALEIYSKGTQRPDLQLFAMGPGVILYRLGEKHREYVRTELYQMVPARKKYVRVL